MFEGKIKFFGEQNAKKIAEQTADQNESGLQTREGRMIFLCGDDDISPKTLSQQQAASRMKYCQGDDDLQEGGYIRNEGKFWDNKIEKQNSERLCLRQPKVWENPRMALPKHAKTVQNDAKLLQNSASVAQNVLSQLWLLKQQYRTLQMLAQNEGHGQGVQSTLSQMQSELQLVTYAMGKVCQSLGSGTMSPIERDLPAAKDFCTGLAESQQTVHQILWNLRDLQRKIDNDGMQIQIFIIYLTLLSQKDDLKELFAGC